MLKELFADQQKHISHFFEAIDYEEVDVIFRAFFECQGTAFFTGVGKSGIIAEKLATTMVSTGTQAQYIPPVNALHGDLGHVSDKDIVVLMSKSGESDELLHLVPYMRNKGAKLISWVSKKDSRLEKACDLSIYLPVQRELCPFDLAPTTSAAIQLIFGDVLAVGLMKAKEFTLDQYAMNHPAGRIGKRIAMKVSDLMVQGDELPLASPSSPLRDILSALSEKRCGCLLVTDEENHLLGIFTDGDLRRSLQNRGADVLSLPLSELMSPSARFTKPDVRAWDAMQQMEADQKRPITVLPVLEEDKVVGLIKMHDILQSGL